MMRLYKASVSILLVDDQNNEYNCLVTSLLLCLLEDKHQNLMIARCPIPFILSIRISYYSACIRTIKWTHTNMCIISITFRCIRVEHNVWMVDECDMAAYDFYILFIVLLK